MTPTLIVIQWLHVFCAIWWFGSLLYSRFVVYPRLRAVGGDLEASVRSALTTGRARMITITVATLTVGLGAIRGAVGGALDDPASAYGLTYLASFAIGVAMIVYLVGGWDQPFLNRLYVLAFPVIFSLMILMRFGL
ncbi:MAG TPA: hypothetical protein VF971_05765 [Candidatus Limnocylindrales bacterium]